MTAASTEIDHLSFLSDVAKLEKPPLLECLLRVLQAEGQELVSPEDRRGIIPLAVPLSRDPSSGLVTALLRWPTAPEGMEVPVVEVSSVGVRLLAKSIREYIHRALVEEDQQQGDEVTQGAVAAAVASVQEPGNSDKEGHSSDDYISPTPIYVPGDFSASGIPKLDVYLMKKVGLFPDVFERLSESHLERGDTVSALVTGEFYANKKHFPGFGRPFAFNAELLTRVGRSGEARDAARIAMRSPWWTLGTTYKELSALAGWGDTQLEFALEKISEQGRKDDIKKGKAPAQVALDQAAFLLDVAAAQGSWDAERERLAGLYEEGGLPDMARFILHGPR